MAKKKTPSAPKNPLQRGSGAAKVSGATEKANKNNGPNHNKQHKEDFEQLLDDAVLGVNKK